MLSVFVDTIYSPGLPTQPYSSPNRFSSVPKRLAKAPDGHSHLTTDPASAAIDYKLSFFKLDVRVPLIYGNTFSRRTPN
jgi:hypothetical protein